MKILVKNIKIFLYYDSALLFEVLTDKNIKYLFMAIKPEKRYQYVAIEISDYRMKKIFENKIDILNGFIKKEKKEWYIAKPIKEGFKLKKYNGKVVKKYLPEKGLYLND